MSSQDTEHLTQTVAANIDAAITAAGKTNRDIGAAIDVSENQVSRWRNGKHGISQRHLIALAAELGHDFGWFYAEHADPEPKAAA